MKKIIVMIMLLCSMTVIARAEGKQYLGVQVGFAQPISRLNNPNSVNIKELKSNVYNGFKIGAVYDATILKGFGYTMGLNYTFGASNTEWKNNNSVSTAQSREKTQLHQLELVVDWQYKFEIAQDTWVILYSGPSMHCGLSFHESTYHREGPNYPEQKHSTDNKNLYTDETLYPLKRLNVTWGIGAGFQYERYFLRGGYDFGIINPYQSLMFEGRDIYTRGRFDQWQIKLGIYLWEK